MKLEPTPRFEEDYLSLPLHIQTQVDQKLRLLRENIRHPSLRVKKIRRHKNLWEASVTMKYRISFEITEDAYVLRTVGIHDKVLRNPSSHLKLTPTYTPRSSSARSVG